MSAAVSTLQSAESEIKMQVPTIDNSTDSVAGVWFALLGGKFLLRIDHEFSSTFADVLDSCGNVIGSATQMYADGGWAVHTKPYAGYVEPSQIIFVDPFVNQTPCWEVR